MSALEKHDEYVAAVSRALAAKDAEIEQYRTERLSLVEKVRKRCMRACQIPHAIEREGLWVGRPLTHLECAEAIRSLDLSDLTKPHSDHVASGKPEQPPIATDGWKLVPIQPTQEMIAAAQFHTEHDDDEERGDSKNYRAKGQALAVWHEMLSAVPAVPQTQNHDVHLAVNLDESTAPDSKPCPFCGSADISEGEVLSEHPIGTITTQSQCMGCGALGPNALLTDGEVDYGSVKSTAAWNTRAQSGSTPPKTLPAKCNKSTDLSCGPLRSSGPLNSGPFGGAQEGPTDQQVAEWAERHDLMNSGSLTDLRCMFEDAASLVAHTAPVPLQREYDYAKRLATWLWVQRYKQAAPEWEPFDDLYGVLSQIDNMLAGVIRSVQAAPSRNQVLEEAEEALTTMIAAVGDAAAYDQREMNCCEYTMMDTVNDGIKAIRALKSLSADTSAEEKAKNGYVAGGSGGQPPIAEAE
jgi:hypothetical protein